MATDIWESKRENLKLTRYAGEGKMGTKAVYHLQVNISAIYANINRKEALEMAMAIIRELS